MGGFRQSRYDYSLVIKGEGEKMVIIIVYVDDLVITGSSLEEINKVKSYLHNNFKIKELGVLKYFLGLEVAKLGIGIILNQRKYVLDLLIDTRMSAAKPIGTPVEQNIHLTCDLFDKRKK